MGVGSGSLLTSAGHVVSTSASIYQYQHDVISAWLSRYNDRPLDTWYRSDGHSGASQRVSITNRHGTTGRKSNNVF